MAKGYRNGFNPFRKGGKFATPGSADGSSAAGAGDIAADLGVTNDTIGASAAKVNAAIRAGRGAGGGSSPSLSVAQIKALPKPDLAKVSPATLAKLKEAFQDFEPDEAVAADVVQQAAAFYRGGVNGVALSLLSQASKRGPTDPSSERMALVRDSLLAAYAEAGITPPATIDAKQMLQIYDASRSAFFDNAAEQGQAYGVVSALKNNDLMTALTLADGPESAGVGWDYQREIGRAHV